MNVVSLYTTESAIEDGVLVHPYPERYPWLLITSAIHAACAGESEKGARNYDQCLVPLLMDCVMEVRRQMEAAKSRGGCDFAKLEDTIAGTVWIMPNDKGGMTIMQPGDY